jgi:hypothetical protein
MAMSPDRPNRADVASVLLLVLFVVSFFLGENAWLGAIVVAFPTIVFLQASHWIRR